MKKILLLIVLSLVLGGGAYAAKIVHLDATRENTIIGETVPYPDDPNLTVYKVSEWLDVSGAGNDAVADAGGVITYPSSFIGSGGLAGVNFTGGSYRMEILTILESDSLFDFTGDASENSGFAMFTAVMDDPDPDGSTHNIRDVLGNSSTTGTGVSMRHKVGGDLTVFIGTGGVTNSEVVDNGETFVQAVNYDAGTGVFTVLDNADDQVTTMTDTVPAGDFSSAQYALTIGYTKSDNRYLEGFLGEVIIYDNVLSAEDFAYQFDMLARKWVESRAVAPGDGHAVEFGPTEVQLEWNNLLQETPGVDVYVDVLFGTDPNTNNMSLEVDGEMNETTTTVSVSDTVKQTYYWAVDTYVDGDPDVVNYVSDPNFNVIEGPVYSFFTSSDFNPTSVSAPDWTTWPNAATPIAATVEDVGDAEVYITFSCDDPNLVFAPNPVSMPGGGGVADPTYASIDYDSSNLTVTMTARDALNIGPPAVGTMTLNVRGSGCQAYRQDKGGIAEYPEDIAIDCKIDMADLVLVAAEWLTTY